MKKKMDQCLAAATAKCARFGLHPTNDPLGELHHTDLLFSEEDVQIGEALAWFLGTLFADIDEHFFYHKLTSNNEWARVARALRVHGLAIKDR